MVKELVSRKTMMNRTLIRCSTATLPLDILASEILPRLPPTTLLRFKCLNKFFYDYISSKEFINRQLNHSVSSGRNRPLIVFISEGGCYKSYNRLYFLDADQPDSPARFLELPQPFCSTDMSLRIVGCCNGLLCIISFRSLYIGMYYFLVLNPSTGKVLSNIAFATETDYASRCFYGFGYDTLRDDYKLVVIEYYTVGRNDTIDRYRKVMVYSMRAQVLRCIDHSYYGDVYSLFPTSHSTCVLTHNHLMHWLSCKSRKESIVCFNLENEQWAADVPLPDFDENDCCLGDDVNLGVLDGCLCISVDNHIVKLKMWIMKEYGVQSSWTKLCIDIPHRFYPIFPSEPGAMKEPVFAPNQPRPNKLGEQTFIWCNIEDNTAKTLQFTGLPSGLQSRRLLCIGSLATAVEGNKSLNRAMGVEMMVDTHVKTLQPNMEF